MGTEAEGLHGLQGQGAGNLPASITRTGFKYRKRKAVERENDAALVFQHQDQNLSTFLFHFHLMGYILKTLLSRTRIIESQTHFS